MDDVIKLAEQRLSDSASREAAAKKLSAAIELYGNEPILGDQIARCRALLAELTSPAEQPAR